FEFVWPLMRRWMDAFVVTSEFGKRGIVEKRRLPAERVHVLYGAAEPLFAPIEDKRKIREHLRSAYGLPDTFIVASGRLDPHKNILRLVEAYDILVRRHGITLPLVVTGGDHSPD